MHQKSWILIRLLLAISNISLHKYQYIYIILLISTFSRSLDNHNAPGFDGMYLIFKTLFSIQTSPIDDLLDQTLELVRPEKCLAQLLAATGAAVDLA